MQVSLNMLAVAFAKLTFPPCSRDKMIVQAAVLRYPCWSSCVPEPRRTTPFGWNAFSDEALHSIVLGWELSRCISSTELVLSHKIVPFLTSSIEVLLILDIPRLMLFK